ncbi:hypothetical protein [Flavobacterium sp.]|uniref:hypothetical protein n=1 Tax=Flavobacterium sp. TaxID=239 RepID=UPI003D0E012B
MKNLFKEWHFMRLAQLSFGILSIFQAFDAKQWGFLLFAGFFLYKAIFNKGCHNQNCSIDQNTK